MTLHDYWGWYNQLPWYCIDDPDRGGGGANADGSFCPECQEIIEKSEVWGWENWCKNDLIRDAYVNTSDCMTYLKHVRYREKEQAEEAAAFAEAERIARKPKKPFFSRVMSILE